MENGENVTKTVKRKRNWAFTLFACIATGVITFLAVNLGNNASKIIEPKGSSKSDCEKSSGNVVDDTSNTQTSNQTTTTQTSNETQTNCATVKTAKDLSIANNKVANKLNAEDTYVIAASTSHIYAEAKSSNVVEVKINGEGNDVKFDKNVTDIQILSSGQAEDSFYILFLMEDGTLEYIPVDKAKTSGIKSYGAVKGVSNVIRVTQSSLHAVGGGYVILAQTADGTLYDLSNLMN